MTSRRFERRLPAAFAPHVIHHMPIHGGEVVPPLHCVSHVRCAQHVGKVTPRSSCAPGQTGQVQGRATDRPTPVHVPRSFHHIGLIHGVHDVGPPTCGSRLPANQARGVYRRIHGHACLCKGLSHPRRDVARRCTEPRPSLLAKGFGVGGKGLFHRGRKANGVFRPGTPSTVAGAVAGEGQQWPTTCRKVKQCPAGIGMLQLVLNDEHRDRVTCALNPSAKGFDG